MGWISRFLGGAEDATPVRATAPESVSAQPAEAQPAPLPPVEAPPGMSAQTAGVLVWEAVLGERSQPLGYRFFLSEAATLRVRGGARVRQFLDAMLISHVATISPTWRSHRQIFLRLDADVLDPTALARLGGAGVHLILDVEARGEPASEASVAAVAQLRADGFRVLLLACDSAPWLASLAGQVDGFAISLGGESNEGMEAFVAGLKLTYPGLQWCALDVPTVDDLPLPHRLGCQAITGPFVSERAPNLGGRFSPDGLRVASLLSKLRQGAEIREMAGVLKQDVALSYRLLRYVNAAAWGLVNPISSIEQAMLMLGRRPLYRWLMLLLLAGAPKATLSEVRGEATLVRARFMELLGASLSVPQRDELFVLGMLSLLDTVLQVPATRLIDTLPMSDTIRAALTATDGDSLYRPYLDLARAWDAGDTPAIHAACERIGMRPEDASRLHLQAFDWVLENGK